MVDQEKFEGVVALIQDQRVGGWTARVAVLEKELEDARLKLEGARDDDTEARELAHRLLDMIALHLVS